uniref:Uncharacterized protein n=1 Tax=Scophthalmus maximus TaxID=52904 RepID=A0A8D3BDZ0_SCOMX
CGFSDGTKPTKPTLMLRPYIVGAYNKYKRDVDFFGLICSQIQVPHDIAELVHLESRKLRNLVHKMPVLSPHLLSNHRELRLAHLALGFISMGYIWQEGKHLFCFFTDSPKSPGLALLAGISSLLGRPPILSYADSVLGKKTGNLRDTRGDNMDSIFSFPGGESCREFFIVSLFVEVWNIQLLKGALLVMHAMKTSDLIGINEGVVKVTQSLKKMKETLKLMHTDWKLNQTQSEVNQFIHILAAQSSPIQCFDAMLCLFSVLLIDLGAFLTRMRDRMPSDHRQLIETLSALPLSDLCQAYNACVSALVDVRSYQLSIVTKYIIVPGNKAHGMGCPLSGVGTGLNTAGTGGSSLMVFLNSTHNATKKALILEKSTV